MMNLRPTQATFLLSYRKFDYVYSDGCDCNDYMIRSTDNGTVTVWYEKCINGERRGHHCAVEIQFRSMARGIKENVRIPETREGIDELLKRWEIIPAEAKTTHLW